MSIPKVNNSGDIEPQIIYIDVPTPILGSIYQSDNVNFVVESFSLNIGLDSPARLSCSIKVFNEVNIPNVPLNLWVGNNTVGLYYVEKTDYVIGRLNVNLFSLMQILDFYPVINNNAEDGCYLFKKGTSVSGILSSILSDAGYTFYIDFDSSLDFTIPSDKRYGNGETLYNIVRDITDFAGGVMVDDVFSGKVLIKSLSSVLGSDGIKIDDKYIMRKTITRTNEYLFSQVFVKDTDGGLRSPVKVYKYKPYPYNKRAIFYTYRGFLNNHTEAYNLASRILSTLEIGDEVTTYELAGLHMVTPATKALDGVVLETNIDCITGESPSLTTTIRVAH